MMGNMAPTRELSGETMEGFKKKKTEKLIQYKAKKVASDQLDSSKFKQGTESVKCKWNECMV